MVKIRLKRQGNKHRPFYRIVVSRAEGGRDSTAIENLGSYNPIAKPAKVIVDDTRALHWLRHGAQPTETVAYLLKKEGVLEKYFESNPKARTKFKFLNKAVAAMSVESVIGAVEPVEAAPVAKAAPAVEPVPAAAVEAVAVTAPVVDVAPEAAEKLEPEPEPVHSPNVTDSTEAPSA